MLNEKPDPSLPIARREEAAHHPQGGWRGRTSEEIESWLISYISTLMEIEPRTLDLTASFDSYGLDSSAAVAMTGDLEDWLGVTIDPTAPYDYPNPEQLIRYLAELSRRQSSLSASESSVVPFHEDSRD